MTRFAIERQLANPRAGRVGDRVADRCGGRTLRRFAWSRESAAPGRSIDVDVDALRNLGEAQHRIPAPVRALDRGPSNVDRFVQRPARRLDDAALDLVANAVGIHRLAAVDRGDGAHDCARCLSRD